MNDLRWRVIDDAVKLAESLRQGSIEEGCVVDVAQGANDGLPLAMACNTTRVRVGIDGLGWPVALHQGKPPLQGLWLG